MKSRFGGPCEGEHASPGRIVVPLAIGEMRLYPTTHMADDPQAPATQENLQQVRAETRERFTTMDEQFQRVFEHIDRKANEIMHYFDVIAEQLRHDAMGANRDDIEGVKDRVTQLERHCGLVAS